MNKYLYYNSNWHDFRLDCFSKKKRAVIVFEGTDAAGKGGAIRRMIHAMNPRGFRVYPIGPPSPAEAERHSYNDFGNVFPKMDSWGYSIDPGMDAY